MKICSRHSSASHLNPKFCKASFLRSWLTTWFCRDSQKSSMSPFFTLFDVPPTLTGTIPVFISCCFYRQNLQSSHEFKYPPSKEFYFSLLPVASCFNLLMALLKMLLLVCPITYYILVKFHALEFSYRPYKIERTSKSCILFQDGGSVLLYGPYKYICVSIKCFKLIYFALKYF